MTLVMGTRKAVANFMHSSRQLFDLLHQNTEGPTDLDLQLLRSQLHMLEMQITNIQSLRELRLKDGETAVYLEQLRRGY